MFLERTKPTNTPSNLVQHVETEAEEEEEAVLALSVESPAVCSVTDQQ